MGNIWLRDLDVVLRNAELRVTTVDGWQTRGNGAFGGYDTLAGICIHHDARPILAGETPAQADAASVHHQCFTDADRPNAALHVARDGLVYVMAAGATNTQGEGGGVLGLPVDTNPPFVGNGNVIGIEQGNAGTGEAYPQAQQDAILLTCRALCDRYRLPLPVSHFEWTPRKLDPAGPSRWEGTTPANGTARLWNMDRFRADVAQLTPADCCCGG